MAAAYPNKGMQCPDSLWDGVVGSDKKVSRRTILISGAIRWQRRSQVFSREDVNQAVSVDRKQLLSARPGILVKALKPSGPAA